MGLKAVLGVRRLRHAAGEGYVDLVELVPHLTGRGVHQHLNLIPELVRGHTLALGVEKVVVREIGPRVGQGQPAKSKERRSVSNDASPLLHSLS